MIGITFALPTESSALLRQLQSRRQQGDLVPGEIANHEVVIAHTGVGAKDCGRCLEDLIHKTRPEFVISSGFAGGVSEELAPGDLVIAENFSDPALLHRAERALSMYPARPVKLFTSSSIVDSITERNKIARACGASAVDMETGAIVEVCKAHQIPLLSLRAISDTPNESFPAPPSILFDLERQRPNYSTLLGYLLTHPTAIPRMIRFGRQVARARAKLTEAIVELVKQS